MFIILNIVVLPSIIIFHNQGDNSLFSTFMDKVQISNLGFSTTSCKDTNLAIGKISINCPSGVITELISYGLSPPYSEIMDACMPNPDT
jgi:hypothetical protein